jgi:hypothetical protein
MIPETIRRPVCDVSRPMDVNSGATHFSTHENYNTSENSRSVRLLRARKVFDAVHGVQSAILWDTQRDRNGLVWIC